MNQLKNLKKKWIQEGIGNFLFNLNAYAIRLSKDPLEKNEVFALCGEDYKIIADSFSHIIDLYMEDSSELLV